MRQVMPWIEPADWPACRAWAEMEFLAGQAYAALRGFGVLNREGEARRLFHDYRQMRQTQAVLSNQLGMTPLSRMALKASGTRAAIDLAKACADIEDAGAQAVVPAAVDAGEVEVGAVEVDAEE
jgi:hypothetical protein